MFEKLKEKKKAKELQKQKEEARIREIEEKMEKFDEKKTVKAAIDKELKRVGLDGYDLKMVMMLAEEK